MAFHPWSGAMLLDGSENKVRAFMVKPEAFASAVQICEQRGLIWVGTLVFCSYETADERGGHRRVGSSSFLRFRLSGRDLHPLQRHTRYRQTQGSRTSPVVSSTLTPQDPLLEKALPDRLSPDQRRVSHAGQYRRRATFPQGCSTRRQTGFFAARDTVDRRGLDTAYCGHQGKLASQSETRSDALDGECERAGEDRLVRREVRHEGKEEGAR